MLDQLPRDDAQDLEMTERVRCRFWPELIGSSWDDLFTSWKTPKRARFLSDLSVCSTSVVVITV